MRYLGFIISRNRAEESSFILPAARRVRARYFSGQTDENLEIASRNSVISLRQVDPSFSLLSDWIYFDITQSFDFQIARKADGALDTYNNFFPP